MPTMAAPTSLTYSWVSSAACFNQFSIYTRRSGPPYRPRQAQFGIAEAFDVVAERRGLFEIEVRGGRPHLLLESGQIGVELLLIVEALRPVQRRRRRQIVALVDTGHHIVDRADDGLRRDVV